VGGFVLGQPSSLNSTNCAVKQTLAVIGHSFGGLLTQILAGRGLSAVSVAIDPAPFRGVLPLPISALRSAFPVLGNPANRNRAVPLTFEQFRYGFANAVSEDEAKQLYEDFAVPASGKSLFQAAAANLNPWTEAKVDTHNPDRRGAVRADRRGHCRLAGGGATSWCLDRPWAARPGPKLPARRSGPGRGLRPCLWV
jgi:non-heme chloroperoxidase